MKISLKNQNIIRAIAVSAVAIVGYSIPLLVSADSPEVATTGVIINSRTAVTLTGFVDSNGLRTTYWFELGKSEGSLSTVYASHVRSGAGTVYEPLINVTPGHTYYYRIVAKNADGQVYGDERSFTTNVNGKSSDTDTNSSESSSSVTTTTSNGGTVTITNSGSSAYRGPSMATTFATNITNTSFTMNGFIDPNGGSGVYRWFEWGNTSDLGNTSGYVAISSSPTNFSYTLTGLQPDRVYYFRAMGRNQYGISSGNVYSVRTTSNTAAGTSSVPPVLSAQPATSQTSSSIQARGIVIPGGTPLAQAYFEWGRSQELGNTTGAQPINRTQTTHVSQTISGLASGATYYYRIVAIDEANQRYYSGINQGVTRTSTAGVSGGDTSTTGSTATANTTKTSSGGGWFSWLFGSGSKTDSSAATGNNGNKSGAAGVVYTGSAGSVLGWFFAIIFFIISVILGIMLRSKNKKEEEPQDVGFPEFPQEFHPQNIK